MPGNRAHENSAASGSGGELKETEGKQVGLARCLCLLTCSGPH